MTADEQQIRERIATWMSATRAGDSAKVLSLMSDDVVFLVAGQPPFGKQKFAAMMSHAPGAPHPTFDGRSDVQEVEVFGDWAFTRTQLTVAVTPPGGKTIHRAGPTLSVWRKTGGQWLLARDANLLTLVEEQGTKT